ncbi:MAG: methionyl-tRNA formyltransferase [Elusimicrobiota bacterium]
MNALFFGTPSIAVPFLDLVASCTRLVAVVTQPDRPVGRNQSVRPSPVKIRAAELGVPVFQPGNPSEIAPDLRALNADAAVVVAYGEMLREDARTAARLGCLNVHFSLLPLYRGAAPVQWALARGETRTGVSLFWIDEGMDTGPMFSQREFPIGPDDDAASLLGHLADAGTCILGEAISEIKEGRIRREPQRGAASLAPALRKEDGRFSIQESAAAIHNKVRAFHLWPKAFTDIQGPSGVSRIAVVKTRMEDALVPSGESKPGTIIRVEPDKGILIQCRDGRIWFETVIPEGKKQLRASDFINGLRLGSGDILPFRN